MHREVQGTDRSDKQESLHDLKLGPQLKRETVKPWPVQLDEIVHARKDSHGLRMKHEEMDDVPDEYLHDGT